jgi:excisionase family DNA binding protein
MSLTDQGRRTLEASNREDQRSAAMLTTADCAHALGVSLQFIRGEIHEGRLKARVSKPPGRQRAKYRIDAADFDAYRQAHWPKSA